VLIKLARRMVARDVGPTADQPSRRPRLTASFRGSIDERPQERRTVLVYVAAFATGLLISTGFLEVGHLLDPCERGWWDFATKVGDERLCSPEGEIAVRFHHLLHGASGALAATVAAVIYRRLNLFDWWPPEGRPIPEA
jgi:hypothetical protein